MFFYLNEMKKIFFINILLVHYYIINNTVVVIIIIIDDLIDNIALMDEINTYSPVNFYSNSIS